MIIKRALLIVFLALVPTLARAQVAISITNAGSTGTTLNSLAKLTGAPSTAVVLGTSDTYTEGIVISNAGTSGNALIARAGQAVCNFDGATTAGDYVQISSTTGGDCHDTGSATLPTSGQILGRVLSTNGGSGAYAMTVLVGSVGYAEGGTVTSVTCNGGLSGGAITTSGTCAIDLTHANTFSGTQTFATIGGFLANIGPTTSTACTLTSSGSAGCSSLTNGQGDCGTFIKHTANTQMVVTIPATLGVGCQVAFEDAGTFGAKGVILNGSAVTAATLHSAHSYTGTAVQYSVVGITIDANSGGSSAIAVMTGDGA